MVTFVCKYVQKRTEVSQNAEGAAQTCDLPEYRLVTN
jgi:hypothetical protein